MSTEYQPLELTKVEIFPEKTCLLQVKDGTIFYYKFKGCQRIYVKRNERHEGFAIADKRILPIIAYENAIYFEELGKIYEAVVNVEGKIDVKFMRNLLKDETLNRSGIYTRIKDGKLHAYRMCDDPDRDGILVDYPPEELAKFKLETIYKRIAIFYSFENADCSTPRVRKLSWNAYLISFSGSTQDISHVRNYRQCENWPLLIIDKEQRAMFAFDNVHMKIYEPLFFGKWNALETVGIHNGVIYLDAVEIETEANYLVTAKLPVHWRDPVDRVMSEMAKLRQDGKKEIDDSGVYESDVSEDLQPEPKKSFESEFLTKFEPKKLLGFGGFGCVFEAQNLIDNWNYAVKRVELKDTRETTVNRALKEVRALASLNHEFLVRYNSSWIEEPPVGWQQQADTKVLRMIGSDHKFSYHAESVFIYIQMELCPQSLCDWLKNNEERDLYQAKVWFKQILSAVAYLHRKKKIHRDLKPNNVLIDAENQAKICDLGVITDQATMRGREVDQERSVAGTFRYMAPEQETGNYTSKVDIFSLGLIMTELCVKMNHETILKVFSNYQRGRSNTVLNHLPRIGHFISLLTKFEPSERPTCVEILKHPFML